MSNNTVVVNTGKCGVQLPEASSELPEERQGLMLMPGENSVTVSYWDSVKDNPAIKIWLRVGILQNRGPGVAVPLATDWNALPIERARKLVERVEDVQSLQRIKKDAKKKTLKAIVDARIDTLMDGNEEKNK